MAGQRPGRVLDRAPCRSPILYRFINRERFDRFELLAERGGVTLLLSMRLVPIVPFSLFSYAAGAAKVPLGRFVWTTAIGYLPLTAVFVYLGSQLEELSATDPVLWIGALVLIALMLFTARLGGSILRAASSSRLRPTPSQADGKQAPGSGLYTGAGTARVRRIGGLAGAVDAEQPGMVGNPRLPGSPRPIVLPDEVANRGQVQNPCRAGRA